MVRARERTDQAVSPPDTLTQHVSSRRNVALVLAILWFQPSESPDVELSEQLLCRDTAVRNQFTNSFRQRFFPMFASLFPW